MYTLEEYGEIFSKLGLTELSVKEGDCELTLKKEVSVVQEVPVRQNIETVKTADEPVAATAKAQQESLSEIASPLVGVFYAGENPDAKPYVTVGETVKKGDVICVIEAMKMFNDVIADKDGVVKEICVANGQLVEFGQTLFKIEPLA